MIVERELFELVAKQALSTKRFQNDDKENVMVILPDLVANVFASTRTGSSSHDMDEHDPELFGMFIAMAFRHNLPINQFFKPSVYKLLLGRDLTLEDLKSDGHEDIYTNLQWVLT